jgi:hypothetical protein
LFHRAIISLPSNGSYHCLVVATTDEAPPTAIPHNASSGITVPAMSAVKIWWLCQSTTHVVDTHITNYRLPAHLTISQN